MSGANCFDHCNISAVTYCMNRPSCMLGCCSDCATKHNGHILVQMTDLDFTSKLETEILAHFTELTDDYEEARRIAADLQSNIEDIEKSRVKCVDRIEEYFAKLHRLLDIRKIKLVETVNEAADALLEHLDDQMKEVKIALDKHANLHREANSYLDKYECISPKDQVESTYKFPTRFCRVDPLGFEVKYCELQVAFKCEDSVEENINLIGCIEWLGSRPPNQKLVYFIGDNDSAVWRCNLELQTTDVVQTIQIPEFTFSCAVYVDLYDAYFILGHAGESKHFLKLHKESLVVESKDCPFLSGCCVAWCGGYLFAIGGTKDSHSSADCYQYNLNAKKWTELPRLVIDRDRASACFFNGCVLVFGGYSGQELLVSIESFNPQIQQWSLLQTQLPVPCASVWLFPTDKSILIFGGTNSTSNSTTMLWWDGISEMEECTDLPTRSQLERTVAMSCFNEQLFIVREERPGKLQYYSFSLEQLS